MAQDETNDLDPENPSWCSPVEARLMSALATGGSRFPTPITQAPTVLTGPSHSPPTAVLVPWRSVTEPDSATPTCRKGGCSKVVQPESEWCAEHGAVVAAGRAWAGVELVKWRHQRRARFPRD